MSVRVMSRVWERSLAKGSGLLVLLAIADYANDFGVAWPGLDAISKKARCKVRRAQQILGELEALGELEVDPQAGPSGCNVYRVRCFQWGRKDDARNHFGVDANQEPPIAPTGGAISGPRIAPDPSGSVINHQDPSIPPTPLQGVEEVQGEGLQVTGVESGEASERGATRPTTDREVRRAARVLFVQTRTLDLIAAKLDELAQRKKAAGELTEEQRSEKRRLLERKREIEGKILGQAV